MRSSMSDCGRTRLRTIITIVATALVIAPAAALAGHSFTDVNDGDFFHDAVDWMDDNGVTVGCNPPDNTQYCPDDFVTRGQMAVFLQRLDTKNVFVRPGEVEPGGGDADTLDGKDSSAFLAADAKATDADLLDGNDSTAFAPVGHTHDLLQSYVNAGTAADTDTTATVTVMTEPLSPGDPCGSGTTRHHYLAHYNGVLRMVEGSAGDVSTAGVQILVDGESLSVESNNGLPKAISNWTKTSGGAFVGALALTRAIEDVPPGAFAVRVDLGTTTAFAVDTINNNLVIQHMGWTCL